MKKIYPPSSLQVYIHLMSYLRKSLDFLYPRMALPKVKTRISRLLLLKSRIFLLHIHQINRLFLSLVLLLLLHISLLLVLSLRSTESLTFSSREKISACSRLLSVEEGRKEIVLFPLELISPSVCTAGNLKEKKKKKSIVIILLFQIFSRLFFFPLVFLLLLPFSSPMRRKKIRE